MISFPWWALLIAVAVGVYLQVFWYHHGFYRGWAFGRRCQEHP